MDTIRSRLIRSHSLARTPEGYAGDSATPLLQGGNRESFLSDSDLELLHENTPYLEYAELCVESLYGPYYPEYQGSRPYPSSFLSNRVALVDHLSFHLANQSIKGGGMFKYFVQETLEDIKAHRQISTETKPSVQTLIFGSSTKTEVNGFIKSFNQVIDAQFKDEYGRFPHKFYHFGVSYCKAAPGVRLAMVNPGGSGLVMFGSPGDQLPVRISFGTYEKRWDIVFDVRHTFLTQNYEGDFTLHKQTDFVPDLWFQLFGKLHGFAIGVGVERLVGDLNRFFEDCFVFRNCSGNIPLKTANLNTLLAFAGWNNPVILPEALNYFCTGGIVLRPKSLRYGYGMFAQSDLPKEVDLFLQSECVATMNIVNVMSLCWLIHWYVNPGIASLFTGKTPVKFLNWFKEFQLLMLRGFLLDSAFITDRSIDPTAIFFRLIFRNMPAVCSPSDIAAMCPTWGNITTGGCPTDVLALEHLVKSYPVLSASIPNHMKFECHPDLLLTLTADSEPVSLGKQQDVDLTCTHDDCLIPLVDNVFRKAKKHRNKVTVHEHLERMLHKMEEDDPAKNLSSRQLLILSAWSFPKSFLSLVMCKKRDYFDPEESILLKPLAEALLGVPLLNSARSDTLVKAIVARRDRGRLQKARELVLCADPRVARKARTTVNVLTRKLGIAKRSDLSPPATMTSVVCTLPVESPSASPICVREEISVEEINRDIEESPMEYSPSNPTEDDEDYVVLINASMDSCL